MDQREQQINSTNRMTAGNEKSGESFVISLGNNKYLHVNCMSADIFKSALASLCVFILCECKTRGCISH